MATKDELILEARELLSSYTRMMCLQPDEDWYDEKCEEWGCPFYNKDTWDCIWQSRAFEFCEKTSKYKEPF